MLYTTTLNGVRVVIKRSTNPDKKLMATFVNKDTGKENVIHFGATGYEHYFDKSNLLPKSLNHNDKKRRALYRIRHYKDIKHLKNNTISAGYLAYYILW